MAYCLTESDVEQNFLWPLLTSTVPLGLGFFSVDIKTKPDLRRLKIDKGKAEKLYHPDYAIVLAGIPVFIVEAKRPDEDPVEGLREARLYAQELNASFPTGINPCGRVVASNGLLTVSAPVDQATPDTLLAFNEVSVASTLFEKFTRLLSRSATQATADTIRNALTSRPLTRALQHLGGQTTRDEDVGYNDFGSKLAIDFRHVFNPESRKDRAHIVRNAYVPSERREHYVDEIDRILKSAVTVSAPSARLIENTERPTEILNALRAGQKLENEIMLLVGPRGSGKSTFVDYCREVKLPADLLAATTWTHLNLNEAPSDKSLIERWLLAQVSDGLRNENPQTDFDDLSVIQKMFSVEINRLKKGGLSLLDPSTEAYRVRLADQILALQSDPIASTRALTRYLCGERSKLLVVVFDNCDKRERDEQLLAFQMARWLQQQIRCLVIMPLRDVTYETYREQPPLDTVIKDLVFRIDPPSFTVILRKRLDLVLTELSINSGARLLTYTLSNGIQVRYPATELGYYLASIFRSLYDYDRMIRSLVLGLAGRDIRKAMEIFLEFCRSGHIGAQEYLKIRTLRGQHSLPYHVVARVLLRRNRRFYNGDLSFVKNLYQCSPEDARPDVFVRGNILEWLKRKYRDVGPTGVKGFHQCRSLISDLMPLGHDAARLRQEIEYLVLHGCIVTEHQRSKVESDDDLVRLAPSGFVHLTMVHDLTYLAACAEETWVEDEKVAIRVADRIARFGPRVHYSRVTVASNAADFASYLVKEEKRRGVNPSAYLEAAFVGLPIPIEIIEQAKAQIEKERSLAGWGDFEERFSVGMKCAGSLDGIQHYGCFVKLDGGPTGLLYFKNLPKDRPLSSFKVGDRLIVEILNVQLEARKLSLGFVEMEGIRYGEK